MTQAHEIINTLSGLGVAIHAQGDNLVIVPKSKVPPDLLTELHQHKADLLALLSTANPCTCLQPIEPAGCGRSYPACSSCSFTWQCKDCGGCRQCAAPGRRVRQPEDVDLPFPIGNGGLDPVQVEVAERINTRLGVVDPVERRLNVLFWLMEHYQGVGESKLADEVKGAYYSLRNAIPDVVRLVRILPQSTMDRVVLSQQDRENQLQRRGRQRR